MCLRGLYNLYTYFTSLTFDLTSDQEKLPNKTEKNREKREEPIRRAAEEDSSPGWTE